MSNSSNINDKISNADTTINPHNGRAYHPDREWLTKINSSYPHGNGWALAGTLSFRRSLLTIENDKVKEFFGNLNYHLNGEFNWKNVPVYWRWETAPNQRIHCHFVLMDATAEFHWLRGLENVFDSPMALAKWLKRNWKHGVAHFRSYDDQGWLEYITKDNPLMESCFSPPIHYLKRQLQRGSGLPAAMEVLA